MWDCVNYLSKDTAILYCVCTIPTRQQNSTPRWVSNTEFYAYKNGGNICEILFYTTDRR
jgi:hypothetical protein